MGGVRRSVSSSRTRERRGWATGARRGARSAWFSLTRARGRRRALGISQPRARSDARRAPQLAFGPESALWRRSGDDADGTLTEILTRHRPGRLQRLVLCPPARRIDDAGAGFVACSLSPATVQFAARAQLRLRCLWTEPGSMRRSSARLPREPRRGGVTLDREDCVAIVTRVSVPAYRGRCRTPASTRRR